MTLFSRVDLAICQNYVMHGSRRLLICVSSTFHWPWGGHFGGVVSSSSIILALILLCNSSEKCLTLKVLAGSTCHIIGDTFAPEERSFRRDDDDLLGKTLPFRRKTICYDYYFSTEYQQWPKAKTSLNFHLLIPFFGTQNCYFIFVEEIGMMHNGQLASYMHFDRNPSSCWSNTLALGQQDFLLWNLIEKSAGPPLSTNCACSEENFAKAILPGHEIVSMVNNSHVSVSCILLRDTITYQLACKKCQKLMMIEQLD
jgi:hypothetical protein